MNNLYTALLKVQSKAPHLQRDAINPHFSSKYISLETLMSAVMPVLTEHGLVWVTRPVSDGDDPVLNYRLIHAESGEVLEGTMPLMLDKQHSQGLGSAITYARRYSLMAVLGLVADQDDDGNRASEVERVRPIVRPEEGAQPVPIALGGTARERVASEKQQWLIKRRAKDAGCSKSELGVIVAAVTGVQVPIAEADEWLDQNLSGLPARFVDDILKEIGTAQPTG